MQPKASVSVAKVSEIATHWQVTAETARNILNANFIIPASKTPYRYRWRDIWTLEGVGNVPPHMEDEWKKPLKSITDILKDFPYLETRALRSRAQKGKLPGLKIGKQWRFHEVAILQITRYG